MKNKLNIIQLRKKRWNGYTWADVIKLLNIHLPKCDYTSIIELDKRISNLLSIPKKYVTEVRLSTFKLPNNIKWENEKFLIENAFEYKFPDTFFGPFILECTNPNCYELQEYTTKSNLLRVLGFEHDAYNTTKDENKSTCGICSRSANREGWILSEEHARNRKLNAYNYVYKTNYTSVDEIPEDNEYQKWARRAREKSKIVLKRERPDDYKLYQNNTWDGINLNLLSIDHIKPLHECFKDGWSIEKACRISNLQILSMKENILKENPEAKFNEKRD